MVELFKHIQAVRGDYVVPSLCVRCDTLADYQEWTDWTGEAPDAVHAFGFAYTSSASPWQQKIDTWDACLGAIKTLCATWDGYILDWALPLCTDSQDLDETASGAHDVTINAMLDALLAHNATENIRLRIGHEAGFPTAWPWSATYDAAAAAKYVATFQHMAALVKAKSSRFVIEWCVTPHCYDWTSATVDPVSFYPGDSAVDCVAIDHYMIGSDVGHKRNFDRTALSIDYLAAEGFEFGVRHLSDFAKAHGERLSFPEIGIGSENPAFLRDVINFCADPANNVDRLGYWNKNAGVNGPDFDYPCRLSDNSNAYPLSKAAWLDCYYGTGKALTEQSETSSFLACTDNTQTTARRAAYDTLIKSLKESGVYWVLDGLYLLAGADEEIARIGPNLPGSFNTTVSITTGILQKNGGLAFSADEGYAGDGSSAYLESNLNPSALAGQFAQDSAHMGAFMLDAADNGGGQSYECGFANSFIARNTAGRWVARVNTASTVTVGNIAEDAGHVIWNRTGAAEWASYFNGAASRSGSDASNALASANLQICGVPGLGYSQNRIAIVHWGGALQVSANLNQPQLLHDAMLAYLQAVGAVA